MKKVILGIHGLGNKPPKSLLEHWWKLSMTEGLIASGYKGVLPKFELVYWADVLHEKPLSLSEEDTGSAFHIDEPYVMGLKDTPSKIHDTRKKVVDFLGKTVNRVFLKEDLSLNYSFISDTLINRYFRDLEIYYSGNCTGKTELHCAAKKMIRERLSSVLEKYPNDEIFLIGHSMGSVVAFDVMTFMLPHFRVKTFVTMGSPLGLPMIISKIASEKKKTGHDTVHLQTPASVTGGWYNLSDILDKIALNYKLSEFFSENSYGVKPVDQLVVNNYEVNGKSNPHKSYGYLRTPEFSNILQKFILEERTLKKKNIHGKIVDFVRKRL